MSRFKVIEHKSGLELIVNPFAARARELRHSALVLDTETTGSAADDEVIELGVVRAANGEIVINRQFKPSKSVTPFALRVHGITDARLSYQPRIADQWMDLYPLLDGTTCVAWNAAYDSRLLTQTIRKYGLDEPQIEWVCGMRLYREFRQLPKDCKLQDACNALNVRAGDHRAINDALAAARILYRMADAAPEDEVFVYDRSAEVGDADEMAMTARDFLTQFGWREEKIVAVGADEVVRRWVDPDGGQICAFSIAMELQRARM